MSALNYNWADLYPNMGHQTTSLSTVADPDDQQAMVDDQDLAVKYQVKENPVSTRNIWIALIVIVGVICCLGMVKS